MGWLITGTIVMALGLTIPLILKRVTKDSDVQLPKWSFLVIRLGAVMLGFFLWACTSFVNIGPNETGHLMKVYGVGNLSGGRIIAVNGEKGPQAEVLPPGFHFRLFLNLIYDVETKPVINVPEGKYGYLLAKDGLPLGEGQTFADPFKSGKVIEMIDARTSLSEEGGGQRGPQTTVLTPGTYRINHYLWDVSMDEATEIPKGKVGVIKSNVWGAVNVGNLVASRPDRPVEEIELRNVSERLSVPLVKVGCIGVWNQALNPGLYYINKRAYTVTSLETHLQTWEYRGGYVRRRIDLKIDQSGAITQTESSEKIEVPEGAADSAVFIKVEGWEVPQELRVLVQVTPENAPFVAASVGDIKAVEDKVLTPAIRSILRNVCGGSLQFNEEFRPVRVLDLIENRDILEAKVEELIHREGLKAGVEIKEVRFGEPAIPPEFMVTRLREQLAQQLGRAYKEEEKAQQERISKENARARADQQGKLVEAEIEVMRSLKLAEARKNEGQGEKDKLGLIAEGQKMQALVLGEDRVVELRKFEFVVDRGFKLVETHPDILTEALKNAHKFVPERIFTVNGDDGGSSSLMGAAGILGDFIGSARSTPPVAPKSPASTTSTDKSDK